MQVGARDLLDARKRLVLHFAKAREVHLRPRQQVQADARATCGSRCGRRGGRAAHHALDEALHVFLRDTALRTGTGYARHVHAQFTRELAHGRAGVGGLAGYALGGRGGCRVCRGGSRGRSSSGRRSRRGSGRSRCRGGGRGRSSAGSAGGFQHHDQRAFGHVVADLDLDFLDGAGLRAGHVHGRLVRFQRDQRVFRVDRVAHLHVDVDHRHGVVVADVRHLDFHETATAATSSRRGRRSRCGSGRGCRGRSRRRSGGRRGSGGRGKCGGAGTCRFQHHQHRAFGHVVAHLDADFLDGAGLRAGHVHGRLVRLQRHQRVFRVDGIARLHVHFDDGYGVVVADIRHLDFNRLTHSVSLLGSRHSRLHTTNARRGYSRLTLLSRCHAARRRRASRGRPRRGGCRTAGGFRRVSPGIRPTSGSACSGRGCTS
ncbi:hypothetical protein D3C87_1198720 [compost metagenome]